MFDKGDDYIRLLRNNNSNNDIENQYTQTGKSLKIAEHIVDTNSSKSYITKSASYAKFATDLVLQEDETLKIFNASNIFTGKQIHSNRFNKFARYGIIDPYHENMGTREYLFFSKPDLHIFDINSFKLYDPLSEVPFFKSAINQYPESLLSLQQTFNYTKTSNFPNGFNVNNRFMSILSNQVSSSLDLPAITATETQNNANLYQLSTSYRDGSEVSDCGYEFSLEFKDTKYLDVYMLFKAYDEYIRQEYLREIRPTKYSYIANKINSKQFSVWKLIVDDTNTIMFYAKAIGINPLSVPRDSMSNLESNIIRTTVNFKGQFVRDMNPIHLQEINHLTALSLGISEDNIEKNIAKKALELYDSENYCPNTEWGSYPYIIKSGKRHDATDKEGNFFKLVWIK